MLHRTCAEEYPLARAISGRPWPEFWQAPALALNLEAAANGFPDWHRLHPLFRQAIRALRDVQRARPHLPPRALRPQRILYREALLNVYHGNIRVLFRKRLCRWFPDKVAEIDSVSWGDVRAALSSLPPAWSFAVLKTLSSGWITPTRFQEQNPRIRVPRAPQ
eukprot:8333852-Pyramimonas_sp.AAC.1